MKRVVRGVFWLVITLVGIFGIVWLFDHADPLRLIGVLALVGMWALYRSLQEVCGALREVSGKLDHLVEIRDQIQAALPASAKWAMRLGK